MSNTKSVEQQLKEAIEASKQTLALSEQVTSLASEKEALSKRLAEIESALSAPKAEQPVAVDPLVISKLGELLAERELTAKTIKELSAQVVRLEKEAAKKADLNEYVKQRLEEGKDGNTPAEKQHLDAGKKDDEACGPDYKKGKKAKVEIEIEESEDEEKEEEMPTARKAKKGEMPEFIKEKIKEREEEEDEGHAKKHGKKAAKAGWDDEMDYGDLSDEEIDMIREHRMGKKHGKKADSTLKAPLEEQNKNFDKEMPQPGLDPAKNNVNPDNTTSPSISKKASKATKKGETDVEEIMESPDRQKEEGEDHEHEVTLSEPEKGAKKHGKKAAEADLEPEAKKGGDELPAPILEYIKEQIKKEKEEKAKSENVMPGINKQDVVGQPDQDEEESVLNKKDSKKGKKAETLEKCVKDNCASDATKVHEDGCAPTKGNTTEIGDKSPLASDEVVAPQAKQTLDSVVDVAVARLQQVAKAKADAEALLSKKDEALAAEVKAKSEALEAVAQLQAKFEALMAKVAGAEAVDKSLEAKAAKLMAATAAEPVAAEISGEAPMTDADYLAKFESITDKREQNRYFKAHADKISRAAQTNLKRRS